MDDHYAAKIANSLEKIARLLTRIARALEGR